MRFSYRITIVCSSTADGFYLNGGTGVESVISWCLVNVGYYLALINHRWRRVDIGLLRIVSIWFLHKYICCEGKSRTSWIQEAIAFRFIYIALPYDYVWHWLTCFFSRCIDKIYMNANTNKTKVAFSLCKVWVLYLLFQTHCSRTIGNRYILGKLCKLLQAQEAHTHTHYCHP